MNIGAGGNDRRRTEEVAQRAFEVAFVLEQRGEPHMRIEVNRLATRPVRCRS